MFLKPLGLFQSGLTCITLIIQMQEMKCKLDIFSSDTFSNGTHWVCNLMN